VDNPSSETAYHQHVHLSDESPGEQPPTGPLDQARAAQPPPDDRFAGPSAAAPAGRSNPARRARRWLVPLVAVLLVCDVTAATLVGLQMGDPARRSAPQPTRALPTLITPTPTGSATATASPLPPPSQGALAPPDRGVTELTAILHRRAQAVLTHDRAGWLADVDPAADEFRASQTARFDSLSVVPIASWTYELDGSPRLISAGTWSASVSLTYRIAGFDTADVRREQVLLVVRRGDRWLLAGDQAPGSPVDRHPRDLWDLGRIDSARGLTSLVLGRTPLDRPLPSYAADADRAVATVSRVWGTAWSRRVVVLVPGTQTEMAAVLGSDGEGLHQIAAVTTGQLAEPGNRRVGTTSSDRVVINPETFSTLSPVGRRVVLAHELTHIATRGSTRSSVPIWLSEGFADYVGYRDSGVPVRVAAEDLLDLVRRNNGPTTLPDEADFNPAQKDVSPAYEGAWLACRLIAQEYGETALVAFYRAVGSSPAGSVGSAENALAAALHDVLGTDEQTFVADWLRYLDQMAGE
jgi:hypothetical protein